MKLEDISHEWPPNIQSYEQKFLGISMTKFIGAGMGGLLTLVIVSQLFVGLGGIIGGAVVGGLVFGAVVSAVTKLPGFNGMTIPGYFFKRTFRPERERSIELPLIVASSRNSRIRFEDWSGAETGAIE